MSFVTWSKNHSGTITSGSRFGRMRSQWLMLMSRIFFSYHLSAASVIGRHLHLSPSPSYSSKFFSLTSSMYSFHPKLDERFHLVKTNPTVHHSDMGRRPLQANPTCSVCRHLHLARTFLENTNHVRLRVRYFVKAEIKLQRQADFCFNIFCLPNWAVIYSPNFRLLCCFLWSRLFLFDFSTTLLRENSCDIYMSKHELDMITQTPGLPAFNAHWSSRDVKKIEEDEKKPLLHDEYANSVRLVILDRSLKSGKFWRHLTISILKIWPHFRLWSVWKFWSVKRLLWLLIKWMAKSWRRIRNFRTLQGSPDTTRWGVSS